MANAVATAVPQKQASHLQGLSKDTLLKWHDEMLLMRRFEEKAAELYRNGKIGGFCHLYNGQEAVSTGSIGALTPEDYVITAYRDHGQAISKGVSPNAIMAELLGKATREWIEPVLMMQPPPVLRITGIPNLALR